MVKYLDITFSIVEKTSGFALTSWQTQTNLSTLAPVSETTYAKREPTG